jgi:hypothetical protein
MLYFRWVNQFEKNNCVLIGLEGGEIGELRRGTPLARQRTKPYTYSMDEEYRRNVKLTDSLYNDQHTIVASPRLRDLLTARLGTAIEALPVSINDHKGRVASKDYTIINLLDLQDCLAEKESEPFYGTVDGKRTLLGVETLTIDPRKIDGESRLFRLESFRQPIVVREELVEELRAAKIIGVDFNEVATI